MVFDLRLTKHLRILIDYLKHLDTLLTMNGAFDLGVLTACYPVLPLSPRTHTVIDLAVINHWECDVRPERSLKAISPLLGHGGYTRTAKDKFTSWADLAEYCAEDTCKTMADIASLARRMEDLPSCPSSRLIQLYSSTLWSTVLMTRNGVPFHRPSMKSYLTYLTRRNALIRKHLLLKHGLSFVGPGSQATTKEFINRCIETVDRYENSSDTSSACTSSSHSPASSGVSRSSASEKPSDSTPRSSVLNDLFLTEKTKQIQFNQTNRTTLLNRLPPDSPEAHILRMIDIHDKQQKIIGSYLMPVLHHRMNRPHDRRNLLVPPPRHPAWRSP